MYRVSSSFEFQDIVDLLEKNEDSVLGKLAYDENIPSEVLMHNSIKHLEELVRKDILHLALFDNDCRVNGVVLAERANWDSEHFGVNVGKLKLALFDRDVDIKGRRYLLKKVKEAARSLDLRVVFGRIALNDLPTVQSLKKEGAILADVLYTFYINLGRRLGSFKSSDVEIAEANERDELVLMEIAKKAFVIDHFHADLRLPRGKCDEVYSKWISSCLKGLVDVVFVARKGEKPIGFVTCNVIRESSGYNYGIIDLVGVDEEHKGKGIGSLLVSKALEWFSNHTKSVYVGTQAANVLGVRLYEKAGFKHILSEATVHLWLS